MLLYYLHPSLHLGWQRRPAVQSRGGVAIGHLGATPVGLWLNLDFTRYSETATTIPLRMESAWSPWVFFATAGHPCNP